MADEPHEVVKLLLARMESHPEEFIEDNKAYLVGSREAKVSRIFNSVLAHASEQDKQLLKSAQRKLQLSHLHHELMEELLNGDEQRRMEVDGQERMRISSSGSVGIGYTSPVKKLSVGSLSTDLNVVSKL